MQKIDFDKLEKNLAVMRGEALAANLLATAAMRTLLAAVGNPEEVLDEMSAFIDTTLNMSGPANGDPDDAHPLRVRETARFHAMQQLDAMVRLLSGRGGNIG